MNSQKDPLGENSSLSSSAQAHSYFPSPPASPYTLANFSTLFSQGAHDDQSAGLQLTQQELADASRQLIPQASSNSSSGSALSLQYPPDVVTVGPTGSGKRKRHYTKRKALADGIEEKLGERIENVAKQMVTHQLSQEELMRDLKLTKKNFSEYKIQSERRIDALLAELKAYKVQTEQQIKGLENNIMKAPVQVKDNGYSQEHASVFHPVPPSGLMLTSPSYHSLSTPPSTQAITQAIENNNVTTAFHHDSSPHPQYSSRWDPRHFSGGLYRSQSPFSLYHSQRATSSLPLSCIATSVVTKNPLLTPQPAAVHQPVVMSPVMAQQPTTTPQLSPSGVRKLGP